MITVCCSMNSIVRSSPSENNTHKKSADSKVFDMVYVKRRYQGKQSNISQSSRAQKLHNNHE